MALTIGKSFLYDEKKNKKDLLGKEKKIFYVCWLEGG